MPVTHGARRPRVWGMHFRITRYADNIEMQRQADTYDVTVIEDTNQNYIPGFRYATMKGTGIANAHTTGAASTMSTAAIGLLRPAWQDQLALALASTLTSAAYRQPSPQPWTASIFGSSAAPGALGARAWLFPANGAEVDYTMPVAGKVGVAFTVAASSKPQFGHLVLPWNSTFTSTGGQTGVDSGIAAGTISARPYRAMLHYHLTDVTTAAGSTVATFSVTLQHSSNNGAYTDIAGTSWVTTGAGQLRKGSNRLALSTGTAIKRWVRINVKTYTGGGSRRISMGAGFARSSE